MNGNESPALRLTETPPPDEPAPSAEGTSPTIELAGEQRDAFKALLGGHECKPGDIYTATLTVTAASPESITMEITEAEPEVEEEAAETGGGEAAPAGGKSAAMTYA